MLGRNESDVQRDKGEGTYEISSGTCNCFWVRCYLKYDLSDIFGSYFRTLCFVTVSRCCVANRTFLTQSLSYLQFKITNLFIWKKTPERKPTELSWARHSVQFNVSKMIEKTRHPFIQLFIYSSIQRTS